MKIAPFDKPQFIAWAKRPGGEWFVVDAYDNGFTALDMLISNHEGCDWRILQADEDEFCRFVTEDVLRDAFNSGHYDFHLYATADEREEAEREGEREAAEIYANQLAEMRAYQREAR